MPPQKILTSEGISGVLNLKVGKAGRRGVAKWKKKYAVMRQDALHLYEGQDDNGRGEDESHTVYLTKYKECIYVVDKKGKKKGGFALVPADSTYEQWVLSCDDTNEQEKWINQLNQAISGDVITIININLDEVTVETPALKHLGKSRPKCKGRRAPSKRPRMDMYDSYQNGECSSDEMEGVTTTDSDTPAKKARSDLALTTPPVTTPDESKAGGAKAFFRGIGLKVSTALGRQKSTGAKTPQSPEPGAKEEAPLLDIPPEERMSLSALLRTLQNIETTSGTIINKAAALRVLFQGSAADSAGLGKPAGEVEKGLEGMTSALEHLSFAENLQLKVKENEESERLMKEEIARKKKEKQEALLRQEEEEQRQKEAEQRRQDEEEQEQKDEEDRQKEEDRLKEEEQARKAKEEALRLAEEAQAEEEKIWESSDEKNESAEMVDQDEPSAQDATQDTTPESPEAKESSPDNTEPMIVENGKENSVAEDEAAEETTEGGDTTENGGDKERCT
ncbi:MAP7 domain-containing protein 2-like isoform X1 [Asterias rubens]|uniref:MAP7 domain-containing protein 2-like isoform X1 n=1 Tax=Asterias rubens TaxID=7604 RepID=UPI0014551490|nr:MAP7 domain-containing protein 2-like isoform X1 [Asterias rubens]